MSESSGSASEKGGARTMKSLGAPVERQHASDQVFREIASAILNKELAADTALPPERELSERFGVSRIVVREAIHRLKEYELVRVRQGSPTIVLDPDRAVDIRLLGLEIDLIPQTGAGVTAFAERQIYAGAALLDLAEQRMSTEDFDGLERLVDRFLVANDSDGDWLVFERAFWTTIAKGTKNRIFLRETLWHFNLIEREHVFRDAVFGEAMTRARLYKSLIEALRRRSGSAAMYLNAVRMAGSAFARR